MTLTASGEKLAALQSLGDELKFVLITSQAEVLAGDADEIIVTPAAGTKCERCWHVREDVGTHADHPTICGRCVSNLETAEGEARRIA